jgi:predicted hotdog family 3-hydroxylacyl-ACP dehydratase
MLSAPAPLFDHDWIAARLPHAGAMCLLDGVLAWDASHVLCSADNQRRPDHPLRQFGRLGAACGIEYAAQAMAVHGALLAPARARVPPGMLVSARGVELHVTRLDDIQAPLLVRAQRLQEGDELLMYGFSVHSAGRLLLRGRASVLLGRHAPGSGPASPAAAPPDHPSRDQA